MKLTHNRTISISELKSRKDTNLQQKQLSLSEFYTRLEKPKRSTETLTEYMALPKAQQDDLKDIGGYVAGTLSGQRRKAEAVTGRDIITLDFDGIPAGYTDEVIEKVKSLSWGSCIHSTRKHSPQKPRLRVLFPLDKSATPDEYIPIARLLASMIGMEWADQTTFEPSRLMYWPSCCSDSEYIFEVQDKPLLSVEWALKYHTLLYGDWKTPQCWPKPQNAPVDIRSQIKKQGDPEAKQGLVGAFCRKYDIFRAIEELLPGVYAPCDKAPDRFTFSGGSTTGGAIVYDGGKFLFSHHATDPCSGKLVNAFDLIRLHKFGHLDKELPANTEMPNLPSYREMCTFAETLPDVAAELARERQEQAIADFSGVAKPTVNDPDDTDVTCLEDVEEREPEWLIQGYIPKGEISVLAGDGGTGKTFVWCNIAAAISSGNLCFLLNNLFQELPQNSPQKVMYFSAEDSNEAVLRPRLRENGANLRNIVTIDSTEERFQKVKLDSLFLEKLIAKHQPALCIFDPLQAFLPRGVNMIARNDMRQAMSKLHVYGEKYKTSFLIVMHTNKKSDVSGRSRLADSADIWDIARSVLIAGKTDSTGLTRYVSHEKSSYGKEAQTALFRINGNAVEFTGYTDKRDRDFVQTVAKEARTAPGKEAAEQFILDYLAEHGRVSMNELDEAAKVYHSLHTVRDAKVSLKSAGKITVQAASEGNKKGVKWYISNKA